MKNIYVEAFKNITCIRELLEEDFASSALTSASVAISKGAVIYRILGTKFILMAHSNQFKNTPNQISWYKICSVDGESSKITSIDFVDNEEIKNLLITDYYEEIMFFASLANIS